MDVNAAFFNSIDVPKEAKYICYKNSSKY